MLNPNSSDERADLKFGTISRLAVSSAQRFGDRPAVIDGASTLSFHDLVDEMRHVGAALIEAGIQRGDRVGLWAPNSASWITAALGVHAAGAWLVPINTRYQSTEAAYVLEASNAAALLVTSGFRDVDYVNSLVRENPNIRALSNLVSIPAPGETTTPTWRQFLDSASLKSFDELDRRLAQGTADDVCDVIFTSGTTGKPKGVMLRHGASLRGFEALNAGLQLRLDDRHLIIPPFFHCFGYKAGWMLDLMVGATAVPVAIFDPEETIATIKKQSITHIMGPPTVFSSILDDPRHYEFDLTSLRVAMVGAANIPERLISRMKDELNLETVMSAYGLTENHALGSFSRPDDPLHLVATTVGRVTDDIDVKIVDDVGQEVAPGDAGAISFRGYSVMSGYFSDPSATEAIVADGWLNTGDIGSIDDAGYLRITGRKKDIYIVGGFNVAPAEIENVLSEFEAIAEVAVVGVPDEYFGEVGAAFVVLTPGTEITSDEVISFARGDWRTSRSHDTSRSQQIFRAT